MLILFQNGQGDSKFGGEQDRTEDCIIKMSRCSKSDGNTSQRHLQLGIIARLLYDARVLLCQVRAPWRKGGVCARHALRYDLAQLFKNGDRGGQLRLPHQVHLQPQSPMHVVVLDMKESSAQPPITTSHHTGAHKLSHLFLHQPTLARVLLPFLRAPLHLS